MGSSEIDRWLKSAEWDRAHERVSRERDKVALSSEAKQEALKKRIRALLRLVFNDESSSVCGRLAMICGHSDDFWRTRLYHPLYDRSSNIAKRTCQLFYDGMRAHLIGLKDHISDIEAELKKVADASEDKSMFTGAVRREAPQRVAPSRPRSQ